MLGAPPPQSERGSGRDTGSSQTNPTAVPPNPLALTNKPRTAGWGAGNKAEAQKNGSKMSHFQLRNTFKTEGFKIQHV